MTYLRKVLGKGRQAPTLTYVQEKPFEAKTVAPDIQPPMGEVLRESEGDIDLSRLADIEAYAKDISVSRESIERWISSGLLMPEELKMAEKLVQLMRKHRKSIYF